MSLRTFSVFATHETGLYVKSVQKFWSFENNAVYEHFTKFIHKHSVNLKQVSMLFATRRFESLLDRSTYV